MSANEPDDRDARKAPRRAVALHYDGENAPRITAKGDGAIAEAIIEKARESGVVLQEDAQLAGLLAQMDLGAEIPRELYVAVAEVIAYAYMLTGKGPSGDKKR